MLNFTRVTRCDHNDSVRADVSGIGYHGDIVQIVELCLHLTGYSHLIRSVDYDLVTVTSVREVGVGVITLPKNLKTGEDRGNIYFHLKERNGDSSTITIDTKPCWSGMYGCNDVRVRRRFVDRMIRITSVRRRGVAKLSMLDIASILGVSQDTIESDVAYVNTWATLRQDVLRILGVRGIKTSTEMFDILNIDSSEVERIVGKLRKNKEIPAGKASHKK